MHTVIQFGTAVNGKRFTGGASNCAQKLRHACDSSPSNGNIAGDLPFGF
jgi:hypothetical protein